jgi:hypothetical protein
MTIPWHTLFGFVVLWSLGFACYLMGRIFEQDKWVRILIGHAKDIDRRSNEHRAELTARTGRVRKAAAAASLHTTTAAANNKEST